MIPAEYGELIDNYIQFCMILEIFRRNQLWDIVQDAWCCGRQRLNKNGSYPYVSIILHGNHLFLCHNHGISSCLAPFLTATRDLNLLTLRIFVTSSSPGLWQGAKVPLPHQEGPAMQVSQEMFINLPRLGMKKIRRFMDGMKLSLDSLVLPHAFGSLEPFLIVFPHVSTGWCFANRIPFASAGHWCRVLLHPRVRIADFELCMDRRKSGGRIYNACIVIAHQQVYWVYSGRII